MTATEMTAAEVILPAITAPSSWAEICDQHPDEWVCLVEVEHQDDGLIRSARVVAHHRSMKEALQQIDSWSPDQLVSYAHTSGRKRRLPRVEVADEIRDLVRARR